MALKSSFQLHKSFRLQKIVPLAILGEIAALFPIAKTHYGNSGEDVIVERIFNRKTHGFYVDVGCFHPVYASNTLKLYRKGWSGINIDADQFKIDVFNRHRKRDINICTAISSG